MKRIVLITTMAFLAGLFAAGQGLGTGEYEHGKAPGVSGSQMEQTRQPEMAAVPLNSSQVRELQKILNDKGFNAGSVDGVIGPRTQQALRDFQKSEGLAATGNPDKQTLQAVATDAKTQEFFGLSPAFGEKGMEEKKPEELKPTPEGTKSMERY